MTQTSTWLLSLLACLALAPGCKRTVLKRQAAPSAPAAGQPSLQRLAASLKAPPAGKLSASLATRLVDLSLHCADREYPNKPGDVLISDSSIKAPRLLHPAFFGCFDWHSAVHGHWTMVRVLRQFPELDRAPRLRQVLERHLSPKVIAGEVEYFMQPHHSGFERPYGWAWLLRLAAELHSWDDPAARRWAAALDPLARLLAANTELYLPRLSAPIRAGTHASTAFALAHIYDYARVKGRRPLLEAVESAARRFYLADVDCPVAYEPSGEDFISPCMAEADLMRRVLPRAEFRAWLSRFLPPMTSPRFAPMLRPPRVLAPKDPRIGHLIGLSLQRAWAMQGVASALAADDPRAMVLRRLAAVHREHALGLLFRSGYGGAHWLASFAVFLLTDAATAVSHPHSARQDRVTGAVQRLP